MLNWEDLRYFIAVANTGSLSAAARLLHVDHATVSRRINSLETSLQNQLVDRNARACRLTPFGQHILGIAIKMEESSFAIERASLATRESITGKVIVSAPPVLATHLLAKNLSNFHQCHPNIQISIASQAMRISLSKREADIALRLVRPTENNDVARKLGNMPFALYAHKNYRYNNDPNNWGFIGYDSQFSDMPHAKWIIEAAENQRIVCEVSDITSQLVAVKSGIGVGSLPCFIGDNDPELQRLQFDGKIYSPEVWLVVHADLRSSPLLRIVLDFMIEIIPSTLCSI